MGRDFDRYVMGRTAGEHDRLAEQGAVMAPATERLLRAAGTGPGQRVLDVGCGVGEVARIAARLVGSGGEVVGVDVDAAALERAQRRLADDGATWFRPVVGDVREVDAGSDFDVVCCRMVLQHQRDAAPLLAAMVARARPGGVVVAQELAPHLAGWFTHAEPAFPLCSQVNAWVDDVFRRSGTDYRVGVELERRLTDAGLVVDDAPIIELFRVPADDDVAVRRFAALLTSLAPAIVEHGAAGTDELDLATFAQRWRAQARAARATVVLWPPLVGAWGRKVARPD